LLTSVKGDKDKSALYLGECRRMGIAVLSPDVNESVANFSAVGENIRFGLTAVRNVGKWVVQDIVQAREEKGRFTSFQDFLSKVPVSVCNKRVIESLVKAGGFDGFGQTRKAMFIRHEEAVDSVMGLKRQEAVGQFDLFGGDSGLDEDTDFSVDIPDVPDWEKSIKLAFEREMLGLYVSDHPLSGLERQLAELADQPISHLVGEDGLPDGSVVTIAGLITSLQRKTTKAGGLWAVAVVEDFDASIEVLCFPKTYEKVSSLLAEDAIVVVKGRVNRRDDGIAFYAQELSVPSIKAEQSHAPVVISLQQNRATEKTVKDLKGVLRDHPGQTEVRLKVTGQGRATLLRVENSLRVDATPDLFGDLKALLGTGCLS
jgi:DNA polymerase-3 subunit alpha